MNLNKNKNKIKAFLAYLSKKVNKNLRVVALLLFTVLVFDYFLFPLPSLAMAESGLERPAVAQQAVIAPDSPETAAIASTSPETVRPGANLPETADARPKLVKTVEITAYNSEVGQCDGDPCTTASGFNVCKHGIEDTIAVNSLPFGTRVRIPDLFGDRIFIVRDRMNSRYHDRVDVWMKDHKTAVKFGIKLAKIEVLN